MDSCYWTSGQAASPDTLKRVIGKENPIFDGYEQHDSNEFLSYLLDTLHEDLNRVKTKLYVRDLDDNEIIAKRLNDE
jgi:ubiquitin C-terminal hydrolase